MSDEQQQSTVDGYELLGLIASGNNSQVWEASEPGNPEHVAVKLLLPEARQDSEQLRVLKHEAAVMKSLEHPAFVRLHKISASKKLAYLAMDYFRAPNLKSQIGSDLSGLHSRTARLVESVCLALDYLHDKGWLHRDIKPENILFNKAGELRLIDFSLSSRASGALGKLLGGKTRAIQGTRTYIAPETLLRKPATVQTDMYSLGITLFEVLTGQPPFTGSSPKDLLMRHLETKPPAPSAFNHNVTPEMDRFILKMLAKKPDQRFKNMKELYAEFRAIKIFKEDPLELAERRERERKARELDDLNKAARIDSRADHERSVLEEEQGIKRPRPVKAKAAPKPQPAAKPGQAAPRPQGPPQPMPAGPMGGPMPPFMPGPPQPFPPGAMPPYGPPGGPMPYPPGYPPPGPGGPPPFPGQRPPMPAGPGPQGYPPQPQPPYGQPPQSQPPQPQAAPPQRAPQPAAPAAAAPQPPQKAPQPAAPPPTTQLPGDKRGERYHPSQKPGDEDLPLMEELPDVI